MNLKGKLIQYSNDVLKGVVGGKKPLDYLRGTVLPIFFREIFPLSNF